MDSYKDIFFISAASSNHYKSLIQLINSILIFYNDANIIIYDIGLTDNEFNFLKETYDTITFKKFDFLKTPFKFEDYACFYSWKPIIIRDEAYITQKPVLWLDAGDKLISRIDTVIERIIHNGVHTSYTGSSLKELCYPTQLKYMNVPDNLYHLQLINGAEIGLNINNNISKKIIDEFAELCVIQDCSGPIGSSRKNHRHDQSILTCLLLKYNKYHGYQGCYSNGISIHNDCD